MNRRRFASTAAALATGAVASATLLTGAAAASTGGVPFKDTSSTGTLTFCNKQNQPVTSGSLDSYPFVWKTIGSAEAPVYYRNTAKTSATLMAYQPIQYVDPGDWTGAQLTGSSLFTNPDHPVIEATSADQPLLGFVQAYPPHWDNLVELRMYFGGTNLGVAPQYESAVIKITGKTWTLVEGGGTSCKAGAGYSRESQLLPKSDFTNKKAAKAAENGGLTPNGGSPTGSTNGSTSSPQGDLASGSVNASDGTSTNSGGLDGGAKAGIGVGIFAVLVAIGAGLLLFRRRSRSA